MLWEVDTGKFISARVPIYSLCFKRDNSQLIVACANELLFFEPRYGLLLGTRLTHHAQIHCVRCSCDGTFFASASMDGLVVVWRSINNEGFVQFNASGPTRTLCWSPTKQILLVCSTNEYQIWHPDDSRAVRMMVSHGIINCGFSPTGNRFFLVFDTGDVNIVDIETNQVIQTFTFSKLATAVSFAIVDGIECLVVSDLERKVSLFRVEDKSLIGRNSLPFECLSICRVDQYLMFSGISQSLLLMTDQLSYLGEFTISGDWVWDTGYNGEGVVAVGRRDGVVELRKIEFALAFSSFNHLMSYRTGINSLTVQSLIHSNVNSSLSFPKVIFAISMSSRFLLVHFRDSLVVYNHNDMTKVHEIPGVFDNSFVCLSDERIFVTQSNNLELSFITLAGHRETTISFSSEVTFLRLTDSFEDAVIVGCKNGDVLIVSLTKTILLVEHGVTVIQAEKSFNRLSIVDSNANCTFYDVVTSEPLKSISNVAFFASNETLRGLYAISDNSLISIYHEHVLLKQSFIQGTLLCFYRNKVVVSHHESVEVIPLYLDFEVILGQHSWDVVVSLIEIGVFEQQWRDVFDECLKRHEFSIARNVVPNWERELIVMVNACDDDDLFSLFHGTPDQSESPHVLEEAGDGEKALDFYAMDGDWPNVLRIVREYHLERHLAEFNVPDEYSEEVAKILLDAGFGDSAIRILTGCANYESLARTHVCLGQWKEAISLCHIVPSITPIIFPKLSQILLESDQLFEALVCMFICQDSEIRKSAIETMKGCSAVCQNLSHLALLELMSGFNDPDNYWQFLTFTGGYLCADELRRHWSATALSEDDARDVFYMSYYVCACYHKRPMVGLDFTNVLTQFLFAASILGQKRWVAYCLRELLDRNVPEQMKRFIQRCARSYKEASPSVSVGVNCAKCGRDVYTQSRVPLLVCGFCGAPIAFSTFSGKPIELVSFRCTAKNAQALMLEEPKGDTAQFVIPAGDSVSDEFLKFAPPEYFIVQSLKRESSVTNQYWFNPSLVFVKVCRVCGSMFHEEDHERARFTLDFCPACHTYLFDEKTQIGELSSDLLNTLQTFAQSNPILY